LEISFCQKIHLDLIVFSSFEGCKRKTWCKSPPLSFPLFSLLSPSFWGSAPTDHLKTVCVVYGKVSELSPLEQYLFLVLLKFEVSGCERLVPYTHTPQQYVGHITRTTGFWTQGVYMGVYAYMCICVYVRGKRGTEREELCDVWYCMCVVVCILWEDMRACVCFVFVAWK